MVFVEGRAQLNHNVDDSNSNSDMDVSQCNESQEECGFEEETSLYIPMMGITPDIKVY